MAFNSMQDNEPILFATTSDDHGSHLDPFFDLGLDFPRGGSDNAIVSNGSFSLRNGSLGGLRYDIPIRNKESYQAAMLQSRMCSQDLIFATPVQFMTRLQQLNHSRHQDSMVISGAQLMALENKDNSQLPVTFARHSYPIRTIPPHTPPTTPQHGRIKPAPPVNEGPNYDLYRMSNGSSLSAPSNMPVKKGRSPQILAPSTPKSQQRDLSASFAQWTERLRNLAVQSPPLGRAPPISPPPSTNIEQTELPRSTSEATLFDFEDDTFEPFSSAATATSSNNSKNLFWDDSDSSTMDSSPWNLDAPVELFGLEDSLWDSTRVESAHPSHDLETYISSPHEHILDSFRGPHEEPHNTAQSNTGLGLLFGSDDLDDNLLGLSNPSLETSFDRTREEDTTSSTTAAILFDTSAGEARISELTSKTPSTSTTTAAPSSPSPRTKSSTTARKHRRTKSAPSLQGTLRGAKWPTSRNSLAASNLAFVNFTPDDRSRILTGVAPSGSSKTKARREKEALERRKRLSEAARRLVFEAGGDGNAVERELSD